MSTIPCTCRRLTVPLSGDGEATLSKLMKDDDAYTFSELPRINPHYKVALQALPCRSAACTRLESFHGAVIPCLSDCLCTMFCT